METNVNYTLVGAFVITLIAAIVLAVIWLSAGLSSNAYTTYKVYMREAVSGLSVDAPVEYNGVSVGTVSTIRIDRKNPHLVVLHLRIKNDTPITNGTRAKLDVRSLSGVAYIALDDRGTDTTPLQILPKQHYAIIPTEPSLFLRLDTALTQLNDNFHQMSESIQALLNTDNLNAFKETLTNLCQVTGVLAIDSKQLGNILNNTAKASQVFQAQTLPDANLAITRLNNLMRNLTEVSTEIQQNPAVLIRGRQPLSLGPGEQ